MTLDEKLNSLQEELLALDRESDQLDEQKEFAK